MNTKIRLLSFLIIGLFALLFAATNSTRLTSHGNALAAPNAPTASDLTIDDVTLSEGNSGTINFTFTVTLNPADSINTITVDYDTTDGTAIAGSDYTTNSGTLTFLPDETTQQIVVPVIGDTVYENTETFTVNLSNPTNATISDPQGVGTITNDDSQPTISITDVTHNEGNAGTTNYDFNVSLSNPSYQVISVNYTTTNGTAIAPGDYTSKSSTLTFNPGSSTNQNITVLVNGDTTFEPTETFTVDLDTPINASISDPQGVGTITNDDGQPSISITDETLNEGNAGTTAFVFTVSLSNPSSQVVSVNYTTTNGTAIAPGDYTSISGTLTFNPGNPITQNITVLVNGDVTNEPTETFTVDLDTPINASISDPQGVGTITNDDGQPTISINDVTLNEGNTGTTAFVFTVSLSNPSSQVVSVHYTTTNGSAIAPGDYTSISGTLTFNPGNPITQNITVLVNGDNIYELDEIFTVDLDTPINASISDLQGVGTITNDDLAAGITAHPTVGDSLATSENGLTATFTVTLTSQPTADVDIYMESSNTNEGRITSSFNPLIFNILNWSIPQTVTVTGWDDPIPVIDGTIPYTITLAASSNDINYSGVNASVPAANADNDVAGLAVSPTSGVKTSEGGKSKKINVLLNTQPSDSVTIAVSSSKPSEGTVYPTSVTFTYSTWDSPQTVTVTGVDDTIADGDVIYYVTFSASSNDTDYNGKQSNVPVTNQDAPTIEWVLPAGDEQIYYFTNDSTPITLKVQSVGSEPIESVYFYRWDHVLLTQVSIATDTHDPFEASIDPKSLYFEFNQIFAVAYSLDGVASINVRVLPFKKYVLFMPSVNRDR